MSAAAMMTRPILSTGEPMPVIGLGTWRAFDVGSEEAGRRPLRQVLQRLLDDGGRIIDTSPMYGQAEAVTGDLLAESGARPRRFLATKVWTTGRERGIEQMRRSAQLLRTEVIDLMQIHNLVDWRTHLATLRRMKEEGRVRYIGITHYTTGALPELARILRAEPGIDFVQLGYSLATRAAETELLPIAADRGVAVIANQPLERGDLFRRVRRHALPDWAREFDCASWAQLLLKYVLAEPAVTCVIPATGNPDHMQDNLVRRLWQSPRRAAARADPGAVGHDVMEGFVGVRESLREITLLDSFVGPERAFQVQLLALISSLRSRSCSMLWSISSSMCVSASSEPA